MIKNKKILIIGGYGFIGSHLYKKLKSDNKIRRFGRNNDNKQKINVKNLKKLKYKFNQIIFCAGSSTVSFGYRNKKNDFNRSVSSVKETLKYIDLFHKKPTFIFISSAAVYGDNIKEKLLKPISNYGKNKLKAEKVIKVFCRKNKIKSVILRFFSLYGPNLKKQIIWDAMQKFSKKKFSFGGTGNEVRSWMFIDDAIKLIILSNNIISYKTQCLDLSSGENIKIKDLLKKILKLMNINKKIMFDNIVRSGNPNYLAKTNKLSKKIGLKKIITLDEGLKKYVKKKN
tara:strand:+ start:369 stop:1223 length:855 start_codon:yes stop_codon:yes gene_type:complete